MNGVGGAIMWQAKQEGENRKERMGEGRERKREWGREKARASERRTSNIVNRENEQQKEKMQRQVHNEKRGRRKEGHAKGCEEIGEASS